MENLDKKFDFELKRIGKLIDVLAGNLDVDKKTNFFLEVRDKFYESYNGLKSEMGSDRAKDISLHISENYLIKEINRNYR